LHELRSWLLSSSEWQEIVDAETHEEAASIALQKQVDSPDNKFEVGAFISVVPIKKFKDDTKLIFSPSVLADIGMHGFAASMIKHIDESNKDDE
jgi:hypothetical protein